MAKSQRPAELVWFAIFSDRVARGPVLVEHPQKAGYHLL